MTKPLEQAMQAMSRETTRCKRLDRNRAKRGGEELAARQVRFVECRRSETYFRPSTALMADPIQRRSDQQMLKRVTAQYRSVVRMFRQGRVGRSALNSARRAYWAEITYQRLMQQQPTLQAAE
jgi:hypothetical protein